MPTNRNNNELCQSFAVGTKIEYNGKLYEVVESVNCGDCSIASICSSSVLSPSDRNDDTLSKDKRINIRKEYDTKITSISNKFFADNNLPFKVGDKVRFSRFAGSATGIIKYVTICNKLDNALSKEPEVMIAIDGYVGLMQRFPISKIKKI